MSEETAGAAAVMRGLHAALALEKERADTAEAALKMAAPTVLRVANDLHRIAANWSGLHHDHSQKLRGLGDDLLLALRR